MHAILARPRGFCAGVERAIRTVELAIEQYGPPIYVRREIVHNSHVVCRLREQGAVFVDELDEVPVGSVAILSAHGVPPSVYDDAKKRQLELIDATCPLVRKVHLEVQRHVAKGHRIIFIGHEGHDEVVGTMGQSPKHTTLIRRIEDAEKLQMADDEEGVILMQTTLSQDDTKEVVDYLLSQFPKLRLPASDDICYATQNRQNAVKELADRIDLLLVVGSPNSSNSRRLTEVARSRGVESHLVDDPDAIDKAWLDGVKTIGITSGASAPEDVVQAVLNRLKILGVETWEDADGPHEGVKFTLPKISGE